MLHFARWKIWAIVASLVLAVALAAPNVLPKDAQDWLSSRSVLRPMTLGLDLQGGSNVLIEVDRKDLRATLMKQIAGDIRGALREARIGYRITPSENAVAVRIIEAADVEKAAEVLNGLRQQIDSGGLLGGGATSFLYDIARDNEQFTFTLSETGFEARMNRGVEQSLKIIENRINGLGTTEATVQRQGKDRIQVQLPGIKDPQRVIDSFGQTGKLTFQLLCEEQATAEGARPPPDCDSLPQKEFPDTPLWVQTSSRATVDGADLNDAQPGFDQSNRPVVTFKFNQKGAIRFGKLTQENVGKRFAIVLDGVIQSAPVINEPILGGNGQISGSFTTEETAKLSVILRSGALPAKLTIVQQTTVGPSLGSDSVNAGLLACVVGLVGVLLFMLVAYGLFGIFANIALIVNLVMLIGLMSVFGFTLTLPGIAGIVLTMGMAVDSNVLVYERIREEWRNGRTALNAIETGFKAAWATILDANATTLIAAVVLFGVGSGPVRGFAVTLSIGVITTIFTAFTLTALLVAMWVRRAKPKELPL